MRSRGIDLKGKWTDLIKMCQASPLTVKEFADENRIGVGSLYIWSKRLGLALKLKTQGEIGFFELGKIQAQVQGTQSCHVEIGVGGLTIKTEVPWVRVIELIKEFCKP